MRAFYAPDSHGACTNNISFDEWLREIVSDSALTESVREDRLLRWGSAPGARFCHPREEHLLPLHVCYGLAAKPSDKTYRAEIMKKQSSMFCQWGV